MIYYRKKKIPDLQGSFIKNSLELIHTIKIN